MSNNEKTLVILTPAFPANESDVNWVHSLQLLLSSIRKLFPSVKISVISFIYPHAAASYSWNDIDVFSFNGDQYKKLKRPLLWRKIWKKLSEIHKTQKIDAILSIWCSECALVGHYFGKRNSVKHFTWICGQDARENNKMVKMIRPLPAELIAKSDFLVDEFYKNHGIKPAHIITNGIDPSVFSLSSTLKDIDIMGAGSLVTLKQYHIFVEILGALKRELPSMKARLCGDGDQAELFRKMMTDLSITDHLVLTGVLPPSEVIKLMQRSKVFLHPSSYEGFSMACLEALAAGAHVISFTRAMHQDIRNWHIVKTKEEMMQKALTLLKDPQTVYEPVKIYKMDDSAASMISLMGIG